MRAVELGRVTFGYHRHVVGDELPINRDIREGTFVPPALNVCPQGDKVAYVVDLVIGTEGLGDRIWVPELRDDVSSGKLNSR